MGKLGLDVAKNMLTTTKQWWGSLDTRITTLENEFANGGTGNPGGGTPPSNLDGGDFTTTPTTTADGGTF